MDTSIALNSNGRTENGIFIPSGQTLTSVLNSHDDNFNWVNSKPFIVD